LNLGATDSPIICRRDAARVRNHAAQSGFHPLLGGADRHPFCCFSFSSCWPFSDGNSFISTLSITGFHWTWRENRSIFTFNRREIGHGTS